MAAGKPWWRVTRPRDGRRRRAQTEKNRNQLVCLCYEWQRWVIFSNSINLGLVEHPSRKFNKLVNLALISTFLMNLDLVKLDCLTNFL